MRHLIRILIVAVAVGFCGTLDAAGSSQFQLDVLVSGEPRPEYRSGSTLYVEALRGHEYALRLTNPTSDRVAVALSVDGLNTIDARHTTPWNASKWVVDPYESIVISGWQVDSGFARRFFFTSEEGSYGAKLGQTDNFGVIEAVVYRERRPRIRTYVRPEQQRSGTLSDAAPERSGEASGESKAERSQPAAPEALGREPVEDYAATGMGDPTRHSVRNVHLDLESHPLSTVRIRYEFRPQLVELGILPARPSPLERRERARGFDFCPE